MNIVFLIGRPNSGKSTQSKEFESRHTNTRIVSPGAWLRQESAEHEKSPLGSFIFHNWSHETLSPIVTEYLDRVVGEEIEAGDAEFVLVDGFPRTPTEATEIPKIVRGHRFVVIELDVQNEELARIRASERQRLDDTESAIDIRMESYAANVTKIQTALSSVHAPIERIDAAQSIEAVASRIDEIIADELVLKRVAIPASPPLRTVARRLFVETSATLAAVIVQKTLVLARSTRLHRQFFGTHPISFTRANVPRIQRYPYLVSLKAMGVRYMMYIADSGYIYLISRKLDVYVSSHRFAALARHDGTLLDGELVGDNSDAPTYFIVLDCLAADGVNCMRENIMERLRRSVDVGKTLYNGPLFLRQQEYVDRSQLSRLFERSRALPWKIDGVILQPARLPYRLGIDFNMFKWKPLSLNSADFMFHAEDNGLYCRLSAEARRDDAPQPYDVSTAPKLSGGPKKPDFVRFGRLLHELQPPWLRDGMVIECNALPADRVTPLLPAIEKIDWLPNELIWVPHQHRSDKLSPNIDWVAQSVVMSILDNVTQSELISICSSSSSSSNVARGGGDDKRDEPQQRTAASKKRK